MFIKRNAGLVGVVLSAALFAAGCGADGTADDQAEDVAETGLAKDDVKRPVGTFLPDPAGSGPFQSLTLNANLTYEAQVTIYCIKAPCIPPTVTGTYHYSHSGSTRYIAFEGGTTGKFAYTLHGDLLRLRRTYTNQWFSLRRDADTVPPYCGGMGETRPRGGCPVGYSCNCPNGAACFVAGTCSPDAAPVRCGNSTCTGGTVCCNPLMGICVEPGQFCIL